MKKYIQLFQLSWQNGFVYRTSLFLWRFRQFLSTIMSLTIWTVVFSSNQSAFGYSSNQMITYIFLASFLQSLVLATSLNNLANRVNEGEITNQLLKPVSLFGYLFAEDVADKSRNVFFILIEMTILFFIFHPQLPDMPNVLNLVCFIVLALMGLLLNFFINMLFGSLGFWSPESWGPKFLFFMFVDFTAGKLFPINILPQAIQRILFFTPFPYFSFVQTQVFLGKYSSEQVFLHLVVLGAWLTGLGLFARWTWKQGLRDYSAAGR